MDGVEPVSGWPMCQHTVGQPDGIPMPWHPMHLGVRAQGGLFTGLDGARTP
jgi:hypothetical protein